MFPILRRGEFSLKHAIRGLISLRLSRAKVVWSEGSLAPRARFNGASMGVFFSRGKREQA